jgi:hypothetical protein
MRIIDLFYGSLFNWRPFGKLHQPILDRAVYLAHSDVDNVTNLATLRDDFASLF